MGLEQRLGHYSFDNPDQQGIPLSALERLHQFVEDSLRLVDRFRQPVQTAIQGLTASTLILSCAQDLLPHPVFAQSLIQSTEVTEVTKVAETSMITTLTQELSDKITKEIVKPLAEKGVNIDLTGELLTNAWVDDQGNRNILYRNSWFMVGMDGQLTVVNALTELGKLGLDQQISQEYSGIDPIPPKSDQPISTDQLDPNVQSVIFTLSQSFKFNAQVTGAKSYGLFNVFRIGDQSGDKLAIIQILKGPQAGQIQLTNIGLRLINTSLIPKEVILSPLPFATGGGNTEIQPGLVFETLQSGKGKQTEWVLQKSPDSPITAVVQRPDALAHVADTYLPRTGLKKVKITFLPAFEGFGIYNGLDFSLGGPSIYLTGSIYGPVVRFKETTVQYDDTLEIYFSPNQEKGYESLPLMQQGQEVLDIVSSSISSLIGTRIAEAGGYPREGAGRLSPEAIALKGNSEGQPPAIVLALT